MIYNDNWRETPKKGISPSVHWICFNNIIMFIKLLYDILDIH